jgi:hypothetical protein
VVSSARTWPGWARPRIGARTRWARSICPLSPGDHNITITMDDHHDDDIAAAKALAAFAVAHL